MAAEENQSITTTTVVVADPRQVSTCVGKETLILQLETGGYYSLGNKVATRIWELIQRPVAVSEVAEVLSKEFVTSQERCEADLLELLPALAERGLLKIVSRDRPSAARDQA